MKKFRFLKLFSIVTMAAAGAFALVNVSNKLSKKAEDVNAVASSCFPSSDGSFYYRAYWNNGNWTSSDAKIWGYFWNATSSCWTSTCINTDDNKIYHDSSSNSTYYVIVPSDTSQTWTGCQLKRYDSSSINTRNTYWNSETYDITFGSTFNCVGPTDYNSKASYTTEKFSATYFAEGSTHYLDLSQGHYDWTAANHKIYAHLYSGNMSTSSIDVELTKVLGFSNEELYQFVVPDGCDYFRLIFHRGTTSSGYTNQTATLYCDASNNVFKLNSYTTGTWDWNLSDSDRANYYGKYFISEITCSGSGSITSLSSNWTNVKNEYNRLSTTIQGIVWTTTSAEVGTDLVKAMYRYDYIIFKKQYSGYDDFIKRANTTHSFGGRQISLLSFDTKKTLPVTIIVVISLVSVSAIGGFFFYKKRRENI